MKKDTITAAVLLCALGAGFLGCVFHTDRTYSLSERRKLAQRPAVTVVDSAGTVVIGEVDYLDDNTVRLTFCAAFSGTAYFN